MDLSSHATAVPVRPQLVFRAMSSRSDASTAPRQDPAGHAIETQRWTKAAFETRIPAANTAQTMLRLMLIARGRMNGHVFVRKRDHHPWQRIYCAIGKNGALRSEDEFEEARFNTFVRDLRGCKVYALLDSASGAYVLHIRSANGLEHLQLRPENEENFDPWFAALLCWQAARATQEIRHISEARLVNRHTYERAHPVRGERTTVIQSHVATMIEQPDTEIHRSRTLRGTTNSQGHGHGSVQYANRVTRKKVLCILYGDGKLVLQVQSNHRPTTATVELQELPRSAIQRLDKHVFALDRVFVIYPQYALSSEACSRLRPIFLSYESMESFEAAFVLLRAFAAPEVYSPRIPGSYISRDTSSNLEPESRPGFLRVEPSFNILVNRFRCQSAEDASFYAEILADGQVKARTNVVRNGLSWYEHHVFQDLFSSVSVFSVRVIQVAPKITGQGLNGQTALSNLAINDQIWSPVEYYHGELNIYSSDLDENHGTEQWWPITGQDGSLCGEILLTAKYTLEHILAEQDYDPLLKIFSSNGLGLTLKIWRHLPRELTRLAEVFTNIFQASGKAVEWFQFLVNEEILNDTKNTEHRSRGSHMQPNSLETDTERENTAIAESTILFRANTLLTKALDMYMKRVGRAYLEQTIGERMRQLVADNEDCEVDPTKLPTSSADDITKNWQRLFTVTEQLWKLIYQSASRFPAELRDIFQHVRKCAKTRFETFVPTTVYSSVSGFVFLRFFCAAIMNPHLFGLIECRPDSRSLRSCLLVAKSIQGLANMTTFGAKESWMSPMNAFYSSHRQEFMDFIDSICAVPSAQGNELNDYYRHTSVASSPEYDISRSICERLPQSVQEGCLSLPYLIDLPRNLARLVDLWLNNFNRRKVRDISISSLENNSTVMAAPKTPTLKTVEGMLEKGEMDDDLAMFHEICQTLRQRTNELAEDSALFAAQSKASSERREEAVGLGIAAPAWVKLAERMEIAPEEFWVHKAPPPPLQSPLVPTSPTPDSFGEQEKKQQEANGERNLEDVVEKSPTTSEKRRRSLVRLVADGKGRRKDSASTSSLSRTSDIGEDNPKPRRKKPPSPPRQPEENALRKLGWI